MTSKGMPTGDQLEQVFHAALTAGDAEGVEAALTVMVGVDPRRAERLYDDLRTAVRVAPFIEAKP